MENPDANKEKPGADNQVPATDLGINSIQQQPDNSTREPAHPGPDKQPPNRAPMGRMQRIRRGWRATSIANKITLYCTVVIAIANVSYVVIATSQLREIRSTSIDTKTLADAAKRQAEKTETISKSADNISLAMQESVNKAEESLNASINTSRLDQRAWIAMVGVGLEVVEIGKPINFSVTIANSGRTFARRTVARFHLSFRDATLTSLPQHSERSEELIADSAINQSVGVLAPNGRYITKDKFQSAGVVVQATDATKAQIEAGYTYIWGDIWYDDIFRKQHVTRFCSWRPGTTVDFRQCGFHNDAD